MKAKQEPETQPRKKARKSTENEEEEPAPPKKGGNLPKAEAEAKVCVCPSLSSLASLSPNTSPPPAGCWPALAHATVFVHPRFSSPSPLTRSLTSRFHSLVACGEGSHSVYRIRALHWGIHPPVLRGEPRTPARWCSSEWTHVICAVSVFCAVLRCALSHLDTASPTPPHPTPQINGLVRYLLFASTNARPVKVDALAKEVLLNVSEHHYYELIQAASRKLEKVRSLPPGISISSFDLSLFHSCVRSHTRTRTHRLSLICAREPCLHMLFTLHHHHLYPPPIRPELCVARPS